MKILPKHPNVVALLGCCTIQGILIFSLTDHLSFVKFMTKSISKQECIPVDAFSQQWPSAGGRGLPQCMLAYTHPLDLSLEPPSPWVWAWRPPQPDPSTSLWVWAWRPPPPARPLNFPLGVSLETPQPDPSTCPLGVGLETPHGQNS